MTDISCRSRKKQLWQLVLAEDTTISTKYATDWWRTPQALSVKWQCVPHSFVLFFFFWLCWVFVAVCGLSLVAGSGGYSSFQCAGFSLRWLLLLRSTDSRRAGSIVVERGLSSCGSRGLECRLSSCGSRGLECRLSSCGARAQLFRGTWDLPRPGLEPVSPALAGGFLSTVPRGKPLFCTLFKIWGQNLGCCPRFLLSKKKCKASKNNNWENWQILTPIMSASGQWNKVNEHRS